MKSLNNYKEERNLVTTEYDRNAILLEIEEYGKLRSKIEWLCGYADITMEQGFLFLEAIDKYEE